MQIVIETLFNWDTQKQVAKGPGIFGTVVAFAPADEEFTQPHRGPWRIFFH